MGRRGCSALLSTGGAQETTSTSTTTTTTTTTNYQVFKICETEMDIYSSDNVSVGPIDSIVVEPEGRIASVVVAPSPQLEVREELRVVPYTGARLSSNRKQLDVARDVIVRGPTVARAQVSTIVQPQFMERVNTHYRTAARTTVRGDVGGAATRDTTEIRDRSVRDTTTRDSTATTRDAIDRPPRGTGRDATATRDANRPVTRHVRDRDNPTRATAEQGDLNSERPQVSPRRGTETGEERRASDPAADRPQAKDPAASGRNATDATSDPGNRRPPAGGNADPAATPSSGGTSKPATSGSGTGSASGSGTPSGTATGSGSATGSAAAGSGGTSGNVSGSGSASGSGATGGSAGTSGAAKSSGTATGSSSQPALPQGQARPAAGQRPIRKDNNRHY